MMPLLETRDLALVRAIVDAGTLTSAARTLALSQSALSHQLRGLESRLGVEVFVRRGRGLKLTRSGHEVLELARDILPRLSAAEARFKRGERPIQRIRLSTHCYTCYHWLPALLVRFHKEHPEAEVEIISEASADPLGALSRGDLDLALTFDTSTSRKWKRRSLFHDELFFVLSPSHPLAKKKTLTQKDLATTPLYVYPAPEQASRRAGQLLFDKSQPMPKVQRIPLTDAANELAKAGLGVALVVGWSVTRELADGSLIARRLKGKRASRAWSGVYNPKKPNATAIESLLDCLSEVATPPAAKF